MGGGVAGESLNARAGGKVRRGVVRAIGGRLAEGESLASICADPSMPDHATVGRWAARSRGFASVLLKMRPQDGGPKPGARTTYCRETAQAIFERLCDGEGVLSICKDPLMPAYSTVWKWRRDYPEFDEAVALARDIQAERFFDKGTEICDAVTPGTATAARVQLTHIRWQAGKLAPKTYGTIKAAEPEQPVREVHVMVRSFKREIGPDGEERVVGYYPDPVTRKMVRED